MTKKFAVLGSPISHSLSPAIHRAAFSVQSLDYSYERFEVSELGEFLRTTGEGYDGFSLTMPLKEQALEAAYWVDEHAQRSRGVNTLVASSEGWRGYNTDVFGLQAAARGQVAGSVAVLGTGATARSALIAFQDQQPMLWGRNKAAQENLASEYGARATELHDAICADLVVSTLPAGVLAELIGEERLPGMLFDVVYVKQDRDAKEGFAGSISGVEMLLHQALAQQRIFVLGDPALALPSEDKVFGAMRAAVGMGE